MASVQFYTQNATEGLVTYTLAEANLLEATKDTHYVENWVGKTTNPITDETVWSLSLSIPLAGGDYVSPDKNYQPLPDYPLIFHQNTYQWYPEYIDVSAEATVVQPHDWELHWRDDYATKPFASWANSGDNYYYYYSDPILPQSYSGNDPQWTTGTYYKIPSCRHILWTMDGNYFPFQWGWFKGRTSMDISTVYYGLRFSWAPYGKGNVNWTNQFENVDNPRFNGINGPLVYGNAGGGENYMSFTKNCGNYTSLSGDEIAPRVYFNFIGFKYEGVYTPDIGDPEPFEEEFIGIIAWEETPDGLFSNAQIMALSKNFFGVRKKPANGGPISGIQGGNGNFSAPSDSHGDRSGAAARAIAANWNVASAFASGYNNYILSASAHDSGVFQQMCTSLWDPDLWQGFNNKFYGPLQSIVCCHLVPSSLLSGLTPGSQQVIKAGGVYLTTDTATTFSNWHYALHLGTIDISEYTGSFADYTDTSIYINLPYVGFKALDTAACMNGWLSVDYLTDVLTGDCTAIVSVCDKFGNTQMRYEWKGHCGRDLYLQQKIPPSTNFVSGIMPAVIGMAAGGIGGALGGAIARAQVGSAAANLMASNTAHGAIRANEMLQRNNFGAGSGNYVGNVSNVATTMTQSIATSAASAAMAGQNTTTNNASGGVVSSAINTNCYVYITRPQWSNPELYERERAYPSDISGKIDDFSGYLSVASAELNNIPCTDVERSEILQSLMAGVYLD